MKYNITLINFLRVKLFDYQFNLRKDPKNSPKFLLTNYKIQFK